jgi:sortase A
MAAIGIALVLQGAWIPAKACLGQLLLERAWRQSLFSGEEKTVRPWSWADTWPVARLEVPAHGLERIVLEGATGRTLTWGPGRHAGSAAIGAPGNTVLSGHRDTHFAFLKRLAIGDRLSLQGRNGVHHSYTVTAARVVHERDLSPLAASDEARVTLITCFPFDSPVPGGPLRYVVTADSVIL